MANGYLFNGDINICDKYVNKGNAIKFIMMYGNLKINQIFTISNNINDVLMMNMFTSFSLRDTSKVKHISKYIISSFEALINI